VPLGAEGKPAGKARTPLPAELAGALPSPSMRPGRSPCNHLSTSAWPGRSPCGWERELLDGAGRHGACGRPRMGARRWAGWSSPRSREGKDGGGTTISLGCRRGQATAPSWPGTRRCFPPMVGAIAPAARASRFAIAPLRPVMGAAKVGQGAP
jgi:hypothetical protein